MYGGKIKWLISSSTETVEATWPEFLTEILDSFPNYAYVVRTSCGLLTFSVRPISIFLWPYHTTTKIVKQISIPIAMTILSDPLLFHPSLKFRLDCTAVAVVTGEMTFPMAVGLVCTTVTVAVGGFATTDTTVMVVVMQSLSPLPSLLQSPR